MSAAIDRLQEDIGKIKTIPIITTMLEVICRVTNMGFAAVARVTDDRWIACSVRDEINFGIHAGEELPIETTICNEIRQSRQGVMIDNVAEHPHFCKHHTPKMYGFQSYISIPIVLHSGEFFGTLCAIDPKPHIVSDLKTTGMFALFTQLIAFHLQAMDLVDRSHASHQVVNAQLADMQQQNSRYEHLTYHSLREPVRMICLYSDMLVQAIEIPDLKKLRTAADDINRFSLQLAGIMRQLNTAVTTD